MVNYPESDLHSECDITIVYIAGPIPENVFAYTSGTALEQTVSHKTSPKVARPTLRLYTGTRFI